MILGQGHYAGTAAVKDLRHLFTQGQELRKGEKKRKEATGSCWCELEQVGDFLLIRLQ